MRLIIGGDSTIGSALYAEWARTGTRTYASTRRTGRVGPDRPFVDLSRLENLSLNEAFTSVVFCAGITNIAECEKGPAMSERLNVSAIVELARRFSASGSYLVFLSSTQVFDGSKPFRRPWHPVCPINEYGRQKVAAEDAILKLDKSGVLRITKLELVESEGSLMQEWKRSLEDGQLIFPYSDVYISPVSLTDVVSRISEMILSESTGISHLGGNREISYADYVRERCRFWDLDEALIKPIPSTNNLGIHYSSLANI